MTVHNKRLTGILAIALCALIALGAVFFSGCSDGGADAGATEEPPAQEQVEAQEGIKVESLYIQDQSTCKRSDALVYRFKISDDTLITSFSYSIDHGLEINVGGTVSEVAGADGAVLSAFDSGVKTISLMQLQEGTHVLTFYLYQHATRTSVYTHVFELTA